MGYLEQELKARHTKSSIIFWLALFILPLFLFSVNAKAQPELGPWVGPTVIQAGSTVSWSYNTNIDIDLDSAGVIHAAWIIDRSSTFDVYYGYRDAGGWSVPELLYSDS